jgi:ferredoxin
MTYVIASPCVADFSCVEICPVNAIHPVPSDGAFDDAHQLYINPTTCVNCGVCVAACPVGAIYEEDALPQHWKHYTRINREYFELSDGRAKP